jgi:hypothetical protein
MEAPLKQVQLRPWHQRPIGSWLVGAAIGVSVALIVWVIATFLHPAGA